MLVSITSHYRIFGIFIAAWILYQSFEAYHTAKALREGQPPPDPLGLNEVGNWLNLGAQPRPSAGPADTAGVQPARSARRSSSGGVPAAICGRAVPGALPDAVSAAPGYPDPAMPPIPPVPPLEWRRREPIGAIVLIALGLLFLLGQLDLFHGRLFEFAWPLLLICLGVWLIVRRVGDSRGDSK